MKPFVNSIPRPARTAWSASPTSCPRAGRRSGSGRCSGGGSPPPPDAGRRRSAVRGSDRIARAVTSTVLAEPPRPPVRPPTTETDGQGSCGVPSWISSSVSAHEPTLRRGCVPAKPEEPRGFVARHYLRLRGASSSARIIVMRIEEQELRAGPDAELAVDVREVTLDGPDAHVQRVGDLAIGATGGGERSPRAPRPPSTPSTRSTSTDASCARLAPVSIHNGAPRRSKLEMASS